MTYTYADGSATPVAEGRFEIGGVASNDGTFYTRRLSGLKDTPDVRVTHTPPTGADGDASSAPLYAGRDILWEFAARADSIDDVWAAIADLSKRISLAAGPLTATIQYPGRSEKQLTVRLDGRIEVASPPAGEQAVPWRELTVPLHASDPRLYGLTASEVIVPYTSVQTAVGNAGDYPAPFLAKFYGPATNPRLIDDARGLSIDLTITIGAGDHVDVDTLTMTAVRSTDGGTVQSNVTRFDEMAIPAGGAQFKATATGTGVGSEVRVANLRDTFITAMG